MPVMSRPIRPLSAFVVASGIFASKAAPEVKPVTYITGTVSPVPYPRGGDPDPPSTIDRTIDPTSTTGEASQVGSTTPAVPYPRGGDPDPPSTIDRTTRPPTTTSEPPKSDSTTPAVPYPRGGDPDPPSTIDRTIDPTSTTHEASKSHSTTGGTTISIDRKPSATTGLNPDPNEPSFTDPNPTIHSTSVETTWPPKTSTHSDDAAPLGTTISQGMSKPTECMPDTNNIEDARQPGWITDEALTWSNPGGGVRPVGSTSSPVITTDDRPIPPIETVTTGTGAPELVISKPAPSYRGSVTSYLTSRASKDDIQPTPWTPQPGPGKPDINHSPTGTVTPGITRASPLSEPLSTQTVHPMGSESETNRYYPQTVGGSEASNTIPPQLYTTTAENPSNAVTFSHTPNSAPVTTDVTSFYTTPNSAPITTDVTSIRPAANQAAPAATTLGASSRGLFEVPCIASDGPPMGPPRSTSDSTVMPTTTQVTTDDGPFKARATATTYEITSDDGPFRAVGSKGGTPVSDPATEYGTSTLNERRELSSEASVALSQVPASRRPEAGGYDHPGTDGGLSDPISKQRPSSDSAAPLSRVPASRKPEIGGYDVPEATEGPNSTTIGAHKTSSAPEGTFTSTATQTSIKPKLSPLASRTWEVTVTVTRPITTESDIAIASNVSTQSQQAQAPLPSSYYDPRPNIPGPSSTTSTTTGVTDVGVPKLTLPTTTCNKPTHPPNSTPSTKTFTIVREADATAETTTTRLGVPAPTFPALLPILYGWTITADNGSIKTVMPTTSVGGAVLPSLSPGETTSTSCIRSTLVQHDDVSARAMADVSQTLTLSTSTKTDHKLINMIPTTNSAAENLSETLTLTTSTTTDNKRVNMFPTIGPAAVVPRLVMSSTDVGVAEPAALGSSLESYERAYGGVQQHTELGVLRLGAQTALWGILLTSILSKSGCRYAKEAVLTVVSLLLLFLQVSGVEAVGFEAADNHATAQPTSDANRSFSDGAVLGGLGGFALALALLGGTGAWYIKKGIAQTQRDAGVATDAQESTKYWPQRSKDKERDSRRE